MENLNKLEAADVKRLEEEEAFRLKTHEAKKNLQKQKRATQKLAHEKVVSRSISKNFLSRIKGNVYNNLADTGFFYNTFKQKTLETDVLPWLYGQTEEYLEELNSFDALPDELIQGVEAHVSQSHVDTIAANVEKQRLAVEQAAEEERARIAAKNQRRQEREAAKRAAEMARLREQIDEEFIKKGKVEDGIVY